MSDLGIQLMEAESSAKTVVSFGDAYVLLVDGKLVRMDKNHRPNRACVKDFMAGWENASVMCSTQGPDAVIYIGTVQGTITDSLDAIYRVDSAGTKTQVVGADVCGEWGKPQAICVMDNTLYLFSSSGTVYKMPLKPEDGTLAEAPAPIMELPGVKSVATDGITRIFAACSTGVLPSTGALVSFDAQGTVTVMSADGWGNTQALCYLGDGVDGAKHIMPPRSFMADYLAESTLDTKAIDKIWRKYDRDQSGHLDEKECEAFLTDLGMLVGGPRNECVVQQARARMSEAMDDNGNGRIDRAEFVAYMQMHALIEIVKPYTIYYHTACKVYTGRATPIMMLLAEAEKEYSCKDPCALEGNSFAPPVLKTEAGVQLEQLPAIMMHLGTELGLAPSTDQEKAVAKQATLDAADMLADIFDGKLAENNERAKKFMGHFEALLVAGSGFVAGSLSYADFMVFLALHMYCSQTPDAATDFGAVASFLATMQDTRGFKAWQALELPLTAPVAEDFKTALDDITNSKQEAAPTAEEAAPTAEEAAPTAEEAVPAAEEAAPAAEEEAAPTAEEAAPAAQEEAPLPAV